MSRPKLGQIAATIGPFALLMTAALLIPEATTDVVLHRAMYTVWVSIIFATPAFALSAISDKSPSFAEYRRLLWTFAFLAYMAHFYYAFVVLYRSNFSAVLEQQTPGVAISNFIFTGWWAIDVMAIWLVSAQKGLVRILSRSFEVFSFAVFVLAFVFLRPGVPTYLGIGMIATVMFAFSCRLWRAFLPGMKSEG